MMLLWKFPPRPLKILLTLNFVSAVKFVRINNEWIKDETGHELLADFFLLRNH